MTSVTVQCPECQAWTKQSPPPVAPWPCPACDTVLTPHPSPGLAADDLRLGACRHCGHGELYIQKDFPHQLGLGVMLVAFAASAVAYAYYWLYLVWGILIGSVVVDALLYALVGNVTVCYRCLTQHRGFAPDPAHRPFELTVGEKYRQERFRRQQQQQAAAPNSGGSREA